MSFRNIKYLKILFILKKVNNSIPTGELARKTKINYKNISQYLNFLKNEGLIVREFYQVKKKRYVLNSLSKNGENFIISDFYQKFLEFFYES